MCSCFLVTFKRCMRGCSYLFQHKEHLQQSRRVKIKVTKSYHYCLLTLNSIWTNAIMAYFFQQKQTLKQSVLVWRRTVFREFCETHKFVSTMRTATIGALSGVHSGQQLMYSHVLYFSTSNYSLFSGSKSGERHAPFCSEMRAVRVDKHTSRRQNT